MYRALFIAGILVATANMTATSDAQIVRKAGQLIFNKVAGEAGEAMVESAGKRLLREAGEEITKRASTSAARSVAGAGAVTSATTMGGAVVRSFKEEMATAATRLTPRNARRLSMLESELAATGKGTDVMSLLGKHGQADELVDFLWRHKGKLAAGGVLAAMLVNPEGVLGATGDMTSKVIESSGKHIAQPLIKETARPIVDYTAKGVMLAAIALTLLGAGALYLRFGHAWLSVTQR